MSKIKNQYCYWLKLSLFYGKESQTWTDNWGAEDLRVPNYTIPFYSHFYTRFYSSYCLLCLNALLLRLLNARLASQINTISGSPPLGLRLILYQSGSSRPVVTSQTRFPDLINRSYSFPLGFVYALLRPSVVRDFLSHTAFFCFACCCFFFKIHILLVLAMGVELSNQ